MAFGEEETTQEGEEGARALSHGRGEEDSSGGEDVEESGRQWESRGGLGGEENLGQAQEDERGEEVGDVGDADGHDALETDIVWNAGFVGDCEGKLARGA